MVNRGKWIRAFNEEGVVADEGAKQECRAWVLSNLGSLSKKGGRLKALLVVVVVVVCLVLFLVAVFWPSRSRKMQNAIGRAARKGERKGDRRAGRFGDLTRSPLRVSRKAADKSAQKCRDVRRKVVS